MRFPREMFQQVLLNKIGSAILCYSFILSSYKTSCISLRTCYGTVVATTIYENTGESKPEEVRHRHVRYA